MNTKTFLSWVIIALGLVVSSGALMSAAVKADEDQSIPPITVANTVQPIKIVSPMYPRSAAKKNIEGWVRFEFTLNDKGSPRNIKTVESHPGTRFVKEAKKAIKQWRFKASESHDVEKVHQFTIEFKLN